MPSLNKTTRLRVVSANLWQSADPGALAAQIEELEADVVAVQELAAPQAEALGRVLPHGKLEPANDYTGLGIAMRQPGDYWRIAMPCRDARVARLTVDGAGNRKRQVEIINIHVLGPHAPPTLRTMRTRREQWRQLQGYLDNEPVEHRVVVGDLNATPCWPFYRRLAARMRDAARVVAERCGEPPVRTWGPWPGAPRLARIDHAFVDGLEVVDFRTVSVRGADHSAIVVDLALD
jgi:endonuclease/exonuclease/phosphatase family metal-dependent hydrolase